MIQREFEALPVNQQLYEWLRKVDATPIEMRKFETLPFSQQLFQVYDAVEGPYEQRKFESLPTGRQLYQIYAELAVSPISQAQFESVSQSMQLYYIYAAGEVTPMSRQKFFSLTRSQQLWYIVEGAEGFNLHPECTKIIGATFPYVFQPEDEGFYFRPRGRATNSEGTSSWVWGEAVGPILPPQPPQLLWWKLNDGSGTAIAAAVGPAGTTDADWIASGVGFGLDFNGTSDNASSNAVVEYDGAGIITVVLNKVTFDDITTTQILFESSADSDFTARCFLVYITAGELFALCGDNSSTAIRQEKITCPSVGVERSLAFVFNASTVAGDVKIFVNAVEQATTLVTNTRTVATAFDDHIFFLGSRNNAGAFFHGKIDDVRIYSYELTPVQLVLVKDHQQ